MGNIRSVNADSPQPVPAKRSYTYPAWLFEQFFVWAGILVGLIFIASGIYFFDKGGWIGILIGAIWTWFSTYAARTSFVKQCPIVIDETGITALAFGKTWKFIAWPEVTRIKRLRRMMARDLGGWRNGYEFTIVGPHDEINLDDRISDFPVLLSALNFYVQRYQIPLSALDIGTDTLDQIKATVKDKQERKKLLKEGIQSSIDVL